MVWSGIQSTGSRHQHIQNCRGAAYLNTATERMAPCSTFKIWNALIGLESGIIASADEAFYRWDGQTRAIPAWNKNLTLKEAFQAMLGTMNTTKSTRRICTVPLSCLNRLRQNPQDRAAQADSTEIGQTSVMRQIASLSHLRQFIPDCQFLLYLFH